MSDDARPGRWSEREHEGERRERRDEGSVARRQGGEDTVTRLRCAGSTGSRAPVLLGPAAARVREGRLLRRAAARRGRAGVRAGRRRGLRGPEPLPRERPARLALAGLAALTAWTGLSIAWAPVAGAAVRRPRSGCCSTCSAFTAALALLRPPEAQRLVEPVLLAGIVAARALRPLGAAAARRLRPADAAVRRRPAGVAADLLERDGRAGRDRARARRARSRSRARARHRARVLGLALLPDVLARRHRRHGRGPRGPAGARPDRARRPGGSRSSAARRRSPPWRRSRCPPSRRPAALGQGAAMLAVARRARRRVGRAAVRRTRRARPAPCAPRRARARCGLALVATAHRGDAVERTAPGRRRARPPERLVVRADQPLRVLARRRRGVRRRTRCRAAGPAPSAPSGCASGRSTRPSATRTRSTSRPRRSSGSSASRRSRCSSAGSSAMARRAPQRRGRDRGARGLRASTPGSTGTGRCRRSRSSR